METADLIILLAVGLILSIAVNVLFVVFFLLIKKLAIVGAKMRFFGHSLIVKVFKDTSIDFVTDKNPNTIPFGDTLKDPKTTINRTYHTIRDIFRPIHIAVEGNDSTTDLLSTKTKTPGGTEISAAIEAHGWYMFEKARNLFRKDEEKKKFPYWILIIVAIITAIIVALSYYGVLG